MKRSIKAWYVGEPSDFSKSGHSYYSDPKNWQEKAQDIGEFIQNGNYDVKQIGNTRWKQGYKAPDGETYWFDLWEDEYDLDVQKEAFHMWALECGATDILPGGKRRVNSSKKTFKPSKKRVTASTGQDRYIVKIWHEVEGMRGGLPDAAEEIFDIIADSPEQAIAEAKAEWDGPIDRIKIVAINPKFEEEELPFYACTEVLAATKEDKQREKLYNHRTYPEIDFNRLRAFHNIFFQGITNEDCEVFLTDESRFPDLTKIITVRYFNDDEQAWAEESGFEGGFVVRYNDGEFDYLACKDGQLVEVSKDDIDEHRYNTLTKKESFAAAMSDYNRNVANQAYRKSWR